MSLHIFEMPGVGVYVRIRPSKGSCSLRQTDPCTIVVEDRLLYSSPILTEFSCDGVSVESNNIPHIVESSLVTGTGDVLVIGYGHSGTGKTYSIFGHQGAVETVADIFFMKRPSVAFLDVSFLEVYNEKVYDLLSEDMQALQVLEDTNHRVCVRNISKIRVTSPDELLALVAIGMRQRVSSENHVHMHSSRSHAILQVTRPSGESVWLSDLAGSERIRSVNRNTDHRELNSIHKSLHALRRCIMALRGGKVHVPARSSVLTRLLFGSGHIAQCVLIACVSPDQACVQETLSTLDFAACGLGLRAWGSGRQSEEPKGDWEEAQVLRDALDKVTRELHKEKARRIELEQEIVRQSIAISFRESRARDDHFPNTVIDTSVTSSLSENITAASPKRTPLFSPSLIEPAKLNSSGMNESVLSQTWRHNQYDAILKRCWASS